MSWSKNLTASAVFLTGLVLLNGCGMSPFPSALESQETVDDERPLVLILGGLNSCEPDEETGAPSPMGMSFYLEFERELLRPRRGQVDYIASCYESTSDLHYLTSDQPDQVRVAGDASSFSAIVKTFRNTHQSSTVVYAGHSYGGWLAMKVGLVSPPSALMTLDPISPEDCEPTRFWNCWEAPEDINKSQREQLAEETDLWRNYYQKKDWFIRSSAIKQADYNHKVDCLHKDVDEEEVVWRHMVALLAEHPQPNNARDVAAMTPYVAETPGL